MWGVFCVCVSVSVHSAEGREQVTGCSRNPTCDVSFAHVSLGVLCIHVRVFCAYMQLRVHVCNMCINIYLCVCVCVSG